jgi:lysozyme
MILCRNELAIGFASKAAPHCYGKYSDSNFVGNLRLTSNSSGRAPVCFALCGRFMRILAGLSVVLALSVSGCTTSSNVDALDIGQTSSVAPRPQVEIAAAPIEAAPLPQAVQPVRQMRAPVRAMAEPVMQVAEEPVAIEEPVQAAASEPLNLVPDKPLIEKSEPVQVAMVQPPRLTTRAERAAPGKLHGPRFRDAKPIRFGRMSPKQYPVHGVDVSRWQGKINWPKLKAHGANFAFIKATDGGDRLDPMFRKNWAGAKAAGVKRGAYHFFFWCRSGESQARWFIRNVPREAGALPPVIDVEWTRSRACPKRPSPANVRKKMGAFMDALEAHYGQRPIIYTAPDFYQDNLQGAFPNHPFWLRAVAQHPSKVYGNRKWVFWQYSGTGLSKGVAEKIDLNVFNGDAETWRNWLGRAAH